MIIHGKTPDGPEEFYGTLSDSTQVLKSVLYVIQTLVGDAFVVRSGVRDFGSDSRTDTSLALQIYRLHVIWSRNIFIIVLPVLLLTGTCGMLPPARVIFGSMTLSNAPLSPQSLGWSLVSTWPKFQV